MITSRFKGLDLVNSVPEDLWTEVCYILQEVANKTIPKKNKTVKCLSEEALQIKRREKNGERERYIQLNTEFQTTARRDKKAFFNEQCLIREENNKNRED